MEQLTENIFYENTYPTYGFAMIPSPVRKSLFG